MVARISRIPVVAIDIEYHNEWSSDEDGRVEYLLADARYLPFRSNSINFICAISLLEHVEGWKLVIREAFRTLRSPGLLVIQLPNLTYLVESHTKFPLLGLMPEPLKRATVSSVGYPELQFSCTLRNVVSELNRAGFWIAGAIPYYHSNHLKILSIAPSYFIVALKATTIPPKT